MSGRPENTIVGSVKNGFLARMMHYAPPAVVTWLALVNRADRDGRCSPSIRTIREDTGLSRASIYRAIDQLAKANEIDVVSGGGKGNPSNEYHITGSLTNELVQTRDPSHRETKVVYLRDKGGLQNRHKPNTLTIHKNQTPKSPSRKSPKTARGDYSPEYEKFWLAVAQHKRDKKAEGSRRYKEAIAILRGREAVTDPHAFLLEKARAYYSSPLGQTPYCNGPAPWLHQGGYDADPASWQRNDFQTVPAKPVETFKSWN